MFIDTALIAYALPAIPIWAGYEANRRRQRIRYNAIHSETQEAGLVEPPSLHPLVDPLKCIGCTSCIKACPEGDVLGLIDGRATLIDATRCIGHGACASSCPTQAITLVFGTATRGLDIPFVDPDFQTNVPGVYIAGELGGMGLIRNAVQQGCEAVTAIARSTRALASRDPERLDLLIVGAGPAGIAATLAAKEAGLSARTVEQDSLGGSVAHFPRGKLVMTEPAVLPIYGKLNFRTIRKEQLLGIWTEVIERTGVEIGFQERVIRVEPVAGGFDVTTTSGFYRTRHVLLAIGRRGTPRKLGVPGEELSTVVYRLDDPAQYRGLSVAVVGGGDSALEAAAVLVEEADSAVTLCYRSSVFSRARRSNRERVLALAAAGKLSIKLGTEVIAITPKTISLSAGGLTESVAADAVIVCAGGVLPTEFLNEVGVHTERKFGTR